MSDFERRQGALVIDGDHGAGKTFFSVALANMAAMGGDADLTGAALTGTGASGALNGALQGQLLGDAGTLGLA